MGKEPTKLELATRIAELEENNEGLRASNLSLRNERAGLQKEMLVLRRNHADLSQRDIQSLSTRDLIKELTNRPDFGMNIVLGHCETLSTGETVLGGYGVGVRALQQNRSSMGGYAVESSDESNLPPL